MVTRRSFLQRTTMAAAGAALSGCRAARPSALGTPATTADEWEEVRRLFPLRTDLIHMAGLLLASHPAPVSAAIDSLRKALDEDPAQFTMQKLVKDGIGMEVRGEVTKYTGGKPENVAITDSTTMGLGILYNALELESGDEILTTTHDHYSTHTALRYAAARTGASVRKVALYDEGSAATADGMRDRLRAAIRPETRVVAVTWVHSSTGVKVPVASIAEVIEAENKKRPVDERIVYCVDGVHGFGVDPTRPADMGCHFFVAGCHKWLFGPRGTGIIWGTDEGWARTLPIVPAFEMPMFGAWLEGKINDEPRALAVTPGGFHAFEHRWALPAAFHMHLRLGPERVGERITELATRMKEGLAAIPGVTLHTPMDPAVSAGIVCYEVKGASEEEVVEGLAQRRIISGDTPYVVSYARVTPGLWNNTDEVDETVAAVREIAAGA